MVPSYLIIGLGNPGLKYQKTRHNIGQEFVKWLQQQEQFSAWRREKKYFCELSQGKILGQNIILVLPLTFMNEAGKIINKLTQYFPVTLKHIIVIHDDNDIPIGKFKLSFNHGSAGHKGVDSLIKNLSGQNFYRLRIGIQPQTKMRKKAEDIVLKKFSPEERKLIIDKFSLMKERLEKEIFAK